YFLSSTDAGMSKHGFMQSSADAQRPKFSLNLAVLRKDTPSPFLKESDEEKVQSEKDKAAAATPGLPPGVDLPDEIKDRMKAAAEAKKPKDPLKVDFEGLEQRILAFPLPAGNYTNLQAGAANQVYYLSRADGGAGGGGRAGPGGPPPAALNRY